MAGRGSSPSDVGSVPLARWLGRSYLRAAIMPLIFIECTFLFVFWLSGHLTYQRNVEAVEVVSKDYLSDIAAREAAAIHASLGKVEGLTNVLAQQTATALTQPGNPTSNERARHGFGPGGTYYSLRGDPLQDGASFYSGHVAVGPAQIEKVWRTAKLDPLMRHIKQSSPLIQQVYFNSWDSYNRIYPYFDVLTQYAPGMNIPSYNFYYEADAAHNPKHVPVWTDAYVDPAGGGWMVSSIAPVYSATRLEGVVGIDVTLDMILRRVLALKMPWRGYGMLVGRDGSILALPPAGEGDFRLSELTSHDYADAIRQNMFKPDRFNIHKRKDLAPLEAVLARPGQVGYMKLGDRELLATSARIDGAGWTLVILAPASDILAGATNLRAEFEAAGLVMIAILFLFYLAFFLFLWRRARVMSQQVAEPLKNLGRVMQRIGQGDYVQQADHSGVAELDMVADRLVMMGQTLGAAHQKIVEQQDAVQRAFAVEKRVAHGQRRFINLLSHELRTPLTMIDSSGQILRRQAKRLTADDLTARSGIIRTATDRITTILDSAVSLLRLEEDGVHVNIGLITLRQLGARSIADLVAMADQVMIHIDEPDALVRVDASLIASALAAILDNAMKFSEPGSTIKMEMQCVGQNCHIRVCDQGTGIDPDDLPAITERFYRGRNSTSVSGAGVGLFMAQNWIAAHGGVMRINSVYGEGTTVEICLAGVLDDSDERSAA